MIENLLRQCDNFGRPKQLIEIVRLTGQTDGVSPLDFIRLEIPKGAIDLLISISVLKLVNGRLQLNQKSSEIKIPQMIIEKIFESLKKAKLLHNFLNDDSIFLEPSSSRISIRNYQIPLLFSSIRNLLIAFGFFIRDESIKFEFYIHPDYQDWFLSNVIPSIESSELEYNPLQNLLEKRAQQEEFGRKAEGFVLAYEQRARSKHPKVESIHIISDISTHAGYDIRSYSSDNALIFNKFIEVKSYSQTPHFYWSNNEVQAAKKKGAKYFLYLVDREQMHKDTYQPIQIANPATTIFDNQTWNVRGDGYFVQKNF